MERLLEAKDKAEEEALRYKAMATEESEARLKAEHKAVLIDDCECDVDSFVSFLMFCTRRR